MTNNEPQPIPNSSSKPLNLDAIAAEAPAPKRMSISEYNARTNTVACVDCGRGGHTHTPLHAIIIELSSQRLGYACQEHAATHLKVKDLKRKVHNRQR